MLCRCSGVVRVMMAGDWRWESLHGVLLLSSDSDCFYIFSRRINAGNPLLNVTEYPLACDIESRLMMVCDSIMAFFGRLVLFLRGLGAASRDSRCANRNVLSIVGCGSF